MIFVVYFGCAETLGEFGLVRALAGGMADVEQYSPFSTF